MTRNEIVSEIKRLDNLAIKTNSWQETMAYETLKVQYVIALQLLDLVGK